MNQERLKALIELMGASDLRELSLTEGDSQVRLVRDIDDRPLCAPVSPKVERPASERVEAAGHEVCAPLYGVLHLTPAPDQPAFVQVGDSVAAGQTLAVIEAMKMFHTVEATQPGVLQGVMVTSGVEVEAGQVLFRIA